MRQEIRAEHRKDADGNPTGGVTHATGLSIRWQDGPLGRPVNPELQAAIAACHQNIQHGTLRYCPSCPWTEGVGRQLPNGAFVEGVIAAASDRLQFFQGVGKYEADEGRFACVENATAIWHLEQALAALDSRTARREESGIEGTHAEDPQPEEGEQVVGRCSNCGGVTSALPCPHCSGRAAGAAQGVHDQGMPYRPGGGH